MSETKHPSIPSDKPNVQSPLPALPLEILTYQQPTTSRRSPLVRLGGWCGLLALISSVVFLPAHAKFDLARAMPVQKILILLAGRYLFAAAGIILLMIGSIRDRQRLSARLSLAILLNLLALAATTSDARFWFVFFHSPPISGYD